jgi:hypothetical protein
MQLLPATWSVMQRLLRLLIYKYACHMQDAYPPMQHQTTSCPRKRAVWARCMRLGRQVACGACCQQAWQSSSAQRHSCSLPQVCGQQLQGQKAAVMLLAAAAVAAGV